METMKLRSGYFGPDGKCRPGRCPPSHVKAAHPSPADASDREKCMKKDVLATWDGFWGLEGLALSSLVENHPKWGPNCADDAPVRGPRASIIRTTIGTRLY